MSAADHHLSFGASALVQDSLGDAPYVNIGINRSELLGQLLVGESGSSSGDFARRLFLPATGMQPSEEARHDALWSAHLEQLNVAVSRGLYVDASASLRLDPSVAFQNATATLHTSGCNPSSKGADALGVGLSLGVVRLPEMRLYGLDGGTSVSWAFEVRSTFLSLAVSRNDPEMLAKFPQAHGAMNVALRLAVPMEGVFE